MGHWKEFQTFLPFKVAGKGSDSCLLMDLPSHSISIIVKIMVSDESSVILVQVMTIFLM